MFLEVLSTKCQPFSRSQCDKCQYYPGGHFNISIPFLIIKNTQSWDCLILTMGIPLPGKIVLTLNGTKVVIFSKCYVISIKFPLYRLDGSWPSYNHNGNPYTWKEQSEVLVRRGNGPHDLTAHNVTALAPVTRHAKRPSANCDNRRRFYPRSISHKNHWFSNLLHCMLERYFSWSPINPYGKQTDKNLCPLGRFKN